MKVKKPKKRKKYTLFEDKRALRRRRILGAVGALVLLGGLFFTGWMLAKAGLGFDMAEKPASLPVEEPDGQQTVDPAENQQMQGNGPGVEGMGELAPVPGKQLTDGNWQQLSYETLANGQALDEAIEEMREKGITHAVIPLKDDLGNFYYPSALPVAAESYVQAGFDAAEVASLLQQNGIVPVAAISAYADPAAARANRDMAIQLAGGNNYLWLDASVENGGKPWLNPYSTSAQQYVLDVLQEVMELGYTQVVVQHLQFPAAHGLEQADLNPPEGMQPLEQLALTATALQEAAEKQGGICWLQYPSSAFEAAQSQNTGLYGSAFALGVGYYIVEFPINTEMELETELQAFAGQAYGHNVLVATLAAEPGSEEASSFETAAGQAGFAGIYIK